MTEKIGPPRARGGHRRAESSPSTADGPVSIEGYYDEAFSVPGLLAEIAKGNAWRFRASSPVSTIPASRPRAASRQRR
jgi:Asp/Glu/hydantoin racemase